MSAPLRIALLSLLLANVLLVAALAGLFGANPLGGWFGTPREPHRLGQQVRAERMQLLPPAAPSAADAAPRGTLPVARRQG
ncbi:hypothetical protein [Cupriavidus consociatus]|uniref:hypothetical protein n=1 Tax=Cupriavidus consociatus TaxID=2821357 RepID=UPI001AE2A714|nr:MULTISPECIES: hypothetical protein [unclassified Cupriavidus]MBP0622065.1 hypothetical protein [Cupriavidus sp. LEh25]MDK2658741.1 hypothetical protein [Cupriavidus sp. LEh21]